MTDRTLNNVGTAVKIFVGLLTIVGIVFGLSFDNRIERNQTDVRAVSTTLQQHKDNSGIHRTAEEAREFESGQDARWNQLFRELDQLNKRIDNLERRDK
jgi:hypothetical protein